MQGFLNRMSVRQRHHDDRLGLLPRNHHGLMIGHNLVHYLFEAFTCRGIANPFRDPLIDGANQRFPAPTNPGAFGANFAPLRNNSFSNENSFPGEGVSRVLRSITRPSSRPYWATLVT